MKFWITLLASLVTGLAMSQDFTLGERLGTEHESATARSMGLAGAFGGVGADFSNATNNPAGLAFFRKSELGLGLGYQQREIQSTYLNQVDQDESSILRLNNIGFVYTDLKTEWITSDSVAVKKDGLVSLSFAFGMNQKADYDEQFVYNEVNNGSSLISSYIQTASQFASTDLNNLDLFETQALNTGLLNASETNGVFLYSSPISAGGLLQEGIVQRSGTKRDFYLSGAANISNKLYLGATLDVPWVRFEDVSAYTETDVNNQYTDFSSLALDQTRSYEGVGARLNLGAIYRLNDYVRAGLKLQTPTIIDMTENTTISTSSRLVTASSSVADFEDEYVLTLPWNAGFQFVASHPRFGLLSLEADYVDYAATRIEYLNDEFGDFDPFEEAFKDDIDFFYRGAFSFRGGVEGRLSRSFLVRAGAALQQSPYEDPAAEFGADHARTTLALGAGYRIIPSNITIDLGINRLNTGEFNSAYVLSNLPVSVINEEETILVKLNVSKRFN